MVPSGLMYVVAMSGVPCKAKPAITPSANAIKIHVVSDNFLNQGLFARSAEFAFAAALISALASCSKSDNSDMKILSSSTVIMPR